MRLLTALCFLLVSSLSIAAERPNIVWIVSEDNSIHYLKHFFPGGAETPAIKALAAHGLTFDQGGLLHVEQLQDRLQRGVR